VENRFKLTEGVIFEIVLILALLVFVFSSADLPRATKRLPLIIAWLTLWITVFDIVLTLFRQWQGAVKVKEKGLDKKIAFQTAVSTMIMLSTILLWKWFGFIITSIIVTIGFSLFLGVKRKLALVVSVVLITFGLYYVFGSVFKVPLPKGALL